MIALEFRADASPGGLAKAVVRLGKFSENILVDLSVWSKADYLAHWADTRTMCIQRQPTVAFCDSRDFESLTLWIGHLKGGHYRFFNAILLSNQILIEGNTIKILRDEPDEEGSSEVSFWDVPLDEV